MRMKNTSSTLNLNPIFLELNGDCAIYEEMLVHKDRIIDDLRQQLSFMRQAMQEVE